MDKEKILQKSRNENILGDERETQVKLMATNCGVIFALATIVFIMIMSFVKEHDATDAKMIFASIIVGNRFYILLKQSKELSRFELIANLLVVIGGGIMFVAFILEMLIGG